MDKFRSDLSAWARPYVAFNSFYVKLINESRVSSFRWCVKKSKNNRPFLKRLIRQWKAWPCRKVAAPGASSGMHPLPQRLRGGSLNLIYWKLGQWWNPIYVWEQCTLHLGNQAGCWTFNTHTCAPAISRVPNLELKQMCHFAEQRLLSYFRRSTQSGACCRKNLRSAATSSCFPGPEIGIMSIVFFAGDVIGNGHAVRGPDENSWWGPFYKAMWR